MKSPVIRVLSMANFPLEKDIVMLNIRLTTPPPGDCEYYLCGPPMMNAAVINMLRESTRRTFCLTISADKGRPPPVCGVGVCAKAAGLGARSLGSGRC